MIGYHIKEAFRGFAVLAFLGAVIFLALRCQGCKPVEDPGAHRRAIVVTLANGVYVADQACASIARAKAGQDGYELAKGCAFAYDAARLSLVIADEKLDRDDDDVACEVAQAFAYAKQMADLLQKHGGKLPKALQHAFTLAPLLGSLCNG